MQIFENQNNLRVANQIKVLSILRKGPTSLNVLAEKLNVSFTAISKIVEELEQNNIVTKTRKKQKNAPRGRTPVTIRINNNEGVTAAIELGSREMSIVIGDLETSIVSRAVYSPKDSFTDEDLYAIGKILKDLLKTKEVANRPLLGICISCPGMIYSKTGEIKSSSKIKSKISPLTYFFNEFGVPTHMYNDAKIALVGEKIFGSIPRNAQNYMYLHIGNACGIAFSFNGKLYQGKEGFSGELTNLKDNAPLDPTDKNYMFSYSYIAHDIQKVDPSLNVLSKDKFPNKKLIAKLYQEGNPVVEQVVNKYIKLNACQIIAYCDLLDLEYVIIEGSINLLGPKYKELLLKSINEYDLIPFRSKVIFSTIEDNPALLGALYQVNNIYFLNRLEKLANSKSNASDYDISESFGENI